jgi:hypothetical protein
VYAKSSNPSPIERDDLELPAREGHSVADLRQSAEPPERVSA